MPLTITEFQRDLYTLLESAIQGEVVEFSHRGYRFRLVPEAETTAPVVVKPAEKSNEHELMNATQQMTDEIREALKKKWAEHVAK